MPGATSASREGAPRPQHSLFYLLDTAGVAALHLEVLQRVARPDACVRAPDARRPRTRAPLGGARAAPSGRNVDVALGRAAAVTGRLSRRRPAGALTPLSRKWTRALLLTPGGSPLLLPPWCTPIPLCTWTSVLPSPLTGLKSRRCLDSQF